MAAPAVALPGSVPRPRTRLVGRQAELAAARTLLLDSEWLRQEAARLGVPTLAARPWETGFERALAVLERQ